jgi:hypothetical protein
MQSPFPTPSQASPIYTDEFFTGMWTQRNPLRAAAMPNQMRQMGYNRFDSLIDGLNREVTSRLTLKRRAGHSVYNSQLFPPINRFHEFRTFSGATETIRVMADCVANLYDATGPNTKQSIYTKDAAAGPSFMQTIGNTLYWGDGANQKKYVQSEKVWAAAKTFTSGNFIVDTNLNIQVAMGARSANITNVQLTANVVTLTFDKRVTLKFFVGMKLTIAGLTGAAFLNAATPTLTLVNYNQVQFAFVHANYASTADAGTAACAGGATGGAAPAWSAVRNAITLDGAEQWLCKGSAVQNMGIATPLDFPSAILAPRSGVFPDWAADTIYSTSLSILDGNANIQQLTTGGTTGAAEPVWALGLGATTNDGTAQWTNMGPATRANLTAYALNKIIYVTWSYWVTVPGTPHPGCFSGNTKVKLASGEDARFDRLGEVVEVMTEYGPRLADLKVHDHDGLMIDMVDGELVTLDHPIKRAQKYVDANDAFSSEYPRVHFKGKVYNLSIRTAKEEERHYLLANGNTAHNKPAEDDGSDDGYSYEVFVTGTFKATTAGVSGASEPAWVDGVGATVADGTVVWTNIGSQATWLANVGATQKVSLAQTVIDSNGNIENILTSGKSAAAHPVWGTVAGAVTVDNAARWTNGGPFSTAGTAPWSYVYQGKNSVTNTISTASAETADIIVTSGKLVNVQGKGFDDPQVDVIQIYRTAQGGSSFFLLDEIQAPLTNADTWTYSDSSFDDSLNEQIQANFGFIVPPTGLINFAYHLNRLWGSVGNTVYYSAGPDALNGSKYEAFTALGSFIFPSAVRRLWPTSIGLLVFTVSDIYIILGQGTSSSGFYPLPFMQGTGLLHYDAFCANGSTAYLMTAARKVMSLDPGAGDLEIGFPIGDLFDSTYDANNAYCTWHEQSSGDTGMFVSNGTDGWFRMSPTSPPETGFIWSPKATLAAGCKAVQSVETSPGTRQLLVGPASGTAPILFRDKSVNTDNGAAFTGFETFGSILLARPGEIAEIEFITSDSVKVGTQPVIGLRFDEISGDFDSLYRDRQDPPLLPPSDSLFNDRYYTNQNQQPSFGRHVQIKFSWAAEDAANELLSFTIFGAMYREKR